jgi:hypothetical protein
LTIASIGRRCAATPAADQQSSRENTAIAKVLSAASNRVLTKILDEIERLPTGAAFDVAKMDEVISSECAVAAAELLGQQFHQADNCMTPDLEAELRQSLDEANVDLLRCGFDRRTFVFVPQNSPESALIRDLQKVRAEIAAIPAATDEEVVFCEASGISCTGFMQGLERVYPDIAEAASRFFTRADINWKAKPCANQGVSLAVL